MKRTARKKPAVSKSASRAPVSIRPAQGGDVVLVAVTGMSPAILTETVWALAHEDPPVIPSKVVAFGTSRSRDHLRRDLVASGVWENLRRALKAGPDALVFGDTGDHLRVFSHRGRELEDIRSPADNAAAADFVLEHLRAFTDNPDLRVIASIAGGRKTMGALLYAAMTLIARETDRITHVLVDPELESRRDPPFFFPATPAEAKAVTLADVPFVPLRNRFSELGRMPGNFSSLVRRYSEDLRADARGPVLVAMTARGIRVGDASVLLANRSRWTIEFLLHLNRSGGTVPRQLEAVDGFREFLAAHRDSGAREWSNSSVLGDDLKRELNHLRTALTREGLAWMPGLRADSLRLPPFKVVG